MAVLGATFLSAHAAYGVVDKSQAQIIAASKTYPGSIEEISRFQFKDKSSPAMRMVLKTGNDKKIVVYMSPEWILLSKKMLLTPGDRVIVTGPLVKSGNTATLVLKELKKGDRRMVLRKKLAE